MKFAVLVCSMAIGAMADEMGPCSLCPPGVPVINVDVVFPGTDPGGPQFTCGDLETLAPLIGGQAGSEECDALASVYVQFLVFFGLTHFLWHLFTGEDSVVRAWQSAPCVRVERRPAPRILYFLEPIRPVVILNF